MIQKYKRLTVGSIDPANIAKYQTKLNEWEKRKTEIKSNPAAEAVDIETKKYYNLSTDREQFSRYKATLKELFPSKFEDFQKIKYGDPELWKSLKAKYRIVNQYKIDSGDLGVEEILRLDDVVITEKRTMFTSDFKKGGNIAGAYTDGDKANMYFSHSRLSDSTKGYKGKSNLVLLKDNRRFSYIDVIDKGNSIRGETYQDTEAKLFEYFADLYERKPFKSITMLSERGMCDSCKGVMKQFKEQFPDVEVRAISNKKTIGNVWKYRKKMRYDLTYEAMRDSFAERVRTSKLTKGAPAQVSWLYEFDENELEEAERLNVLLPLIKWQIQIGDLTEELSDELFLYYKDYKEGRLDGILDDEEKDEVIKDLTDCYNKVFSK